MDDSYSFEILEPEQMLQRFKILAEGMTVHRENTIVLRSDVYAAAHDGAGRHRFTAAHELGHYILHRGEGMEFPRRSTEETVPYLDSEWQANVFAREFLVDVRRCSKFPSPEAIADYYGVSLRVAEIQWRAKKKWPHSGTI
ncbi:ImmA/IrrE family metallo-endopeptidase [Burkholderia gladioli]|uniref:ImmA/IrrE family metallo-endopeptidase n=1 Tax=Burkholderia gladioli TaxID=28095 RepID=UPI00163EABA3|nr:ImmA/IrrE family metallo-endopeptidase [Burkholderia gladioli]